MPNHRKNYFTHKNRIAQLACAHIAVLALANYAVQFTATVGGIHFTWAIFIFPLVILATDLTVRLSGPHQARIIVAVAYLPAILISAGLANWRIGLASGGAYLSGQLLDIAVFQKIRQRSARWWVAPLLSTVVANIIDTYIFYAAAFYRTADPFMAAHWAHLASVDLAFKIIIATLLFLPAYGLLLNYLLAPGRRSGNSTLSER